MLDYSVDITKLEWVNKPDNFIVNEHSVIIETKPYTDLWHNTYYNMIQNNPHAIVMNVNGNFTFKFKVNYKFNKKYDQCGLVLYVDSNNYIKAGIECKNEEIGLISSVVTRDSYSDWATSNVASGIENMYFRLSCLDNEFLIENSFDGIRYRQMRIVRMPSYQGYKVGLYASSPDNSSFDAIFTQITLTDCSWEGYKNEA